jgi:hypothetical protein
MASSMKPRFFHFVCAHPVMISWCLGAAAVDIFVANVATASFTVFRSEMILPLVIALIPGTFLGLWVGVFTTLLPVEKVCKRLNGAPFRVGDSVFILSGPHKGMVAEVYGTTVGQGGEKLLKLELGPKHRADYSDIFDEYSVTRLSD